MVLDPGVTGSVYVQNAERHTHGVGAPDLGLATWRSATILNHLTGNTAYPLPRRTAFTTFGLTPQEHLRTVPASREQTAVVDHGTDAGQPAGALATEMTAVLGSRLP
jgi:lysine N6-hydroxylase